MKTVKRLAGHAVHADDPAAEYVPLSHAEHAVAAARPEKDPAEQLEQLPAAVAREPAGQGTQVELEGGRTKPGLHWYGQLVAVVPTPV